MGKDKLVVVIGNHTVTEDTHGGILQNIICLDGTLNMKRNTSILKHATVVGNVSMEHSTFICSLHMLAPGEIFFHDNNPFIFELYTRHPIVVHLRKGYDWKNFIYKCYGNRTPIEVRYDLD